MKLDISNQATMGSTTTTTALAPAATHGNESAISYENITQYLSTLEQEHEVFKADHSALEHSISETRALLVNIPLYLITYVVLILCDKSYIGAR